MLVDKTKENLLTLCEKNIIVPVHQHGRHDMTCKPAIENSTGLSRKVGSTVAVYFFQLVCVGILKALFKNLNDNFPHSFLHFKS